MIKKIKNIIDNISNKKITIIGLGISGIGAAKLSQYLKAQVFVSSKNITSKFKKELQDLNIKFEVGEHTRKCLKSDLIIISPGVNPKNKFIEKIYSLGIPIVSEIEFASYFTNSPLIAVTGSNGKSTVVEIINHIFLKKHKNTLIGGNIGISFSSNVLNELKNKLKNVFHILEVSSFQLEKIFLFKPNVCCITNITEDHLERYKDKNDYFNTKLNIIKNITKKNDIIYNRDDKKLNKYFKKMEDASSFSINNKNSNYYINNEKIYTSKNKLLINQNHTKLIGKHNLYNILASIMISKKFNISDEVVTNSLKNFEPLMHRMEKINLNCETTYINDSKGTNIFSTICAIDSFKKNIIIILGGYSSDKIVEKIITKNINRKNIISVICYGYVGPTLHSMLKKIKPTSYYKLFEDAVKNSIKIAKNDDVVLLSPAFKSYDQFKNFEERGNKFKEIVKEYYA